MSFNFSIKILLRRHVWGYVVCLCPTKAPGLNELIRQSMLRSEQSIDLSDMTLDVDSERDVPKQINTIIIEHQLVKCIRRAPFVCKHSSLKWFFSCYIIFDSPSPLSNVGGISTELSPTSKLNESKLFFPV